MPKAENGYELERYAPVARRITLFYERYPAGRIITTLVERDESAVIFRARVYRTAEELNPAATGWALEREGDGDVNAVACLENTETSAIGRALANLGFTASAERPSREEMARVARARQAPLRVAASRPRSAAPAPAPGSALGSSSSREVPSPQSRADALGDVLSLLALARDSGMRPARAARASARLLAEPPSRDDLVRIASRLRAWMRRQPRARFGAV
ncbi:MAG TPA: hypothetical protein VIM15_05260 [Gemmatimonadaceae bacterium]